MECSFKNELMVVREAVQKEESEQARLRGLLNGVDATNLNALLGIYDTWHEESLRKEKRWAPLTQEGLGILHRYAQEAQQQGKLVIASTAVQPSLDIMRINQVMGRDVVTPSEFRVALKRVMAAGINYALGILQTLASEVLVVMPLRTAIYGGDVWARAGCQNFWPVDIMRNDRGQGEIKSFSSPPANIRHMKVVVSDPLFATGGSVAVCIDNLKFYGIPENRIVVHVAVAAPEGIRYILRKFPGVRIITASVDVGLDEHYYIYGPGIGDCGWRSCYDLVGNVGREYAIEHWNFVPWNISLIILERTRKEVEERTRTIKTSAE